MNCLLLPEARAKDRPNILFGGMADHTTVPVQGLSPEGSLVLRAKTPRDRPGRPVLPAEPGDADLRLLVGS